MFAQVWHDFCVDNIFTAVKQALSCAVVKSVLVQSHSCLPAGHRHDRLTLLRAFHIDFYWHWKSGAKLIKRAKNKEIWIDSPEIFLCFQFNLARWRRHFSHTWSQHYTHLMDRLRPCPLFTVHAPIPDMLPRGHSSAEVLMTPELLLN